MKKYTARIPLIALFAFTSIIVAPTVAQAAPEQGTFASSHISQNLQVTTYSQLSINNLDTITIKELVPETPKTAPKSEPETVPHNFDVAATIAAAKQEIGMSFPTGWSQPGECIMSVKRWVQAGKGNWGPGGGGPLENYTTATIVPANEIQAGDVIQYLNTESPNSWGYGIHTVLITGVNEDGTYQIVEANNPGGSGLVSENLSWTPKPPTGWDAVAFRF